MTVRFVLLDADGVVQRFAPNFIDRLSQLTPDPNKQGFLNEVFAAESLYMEGGDGFPDALSDVLRRWRVSAAVEEALALWNDIEVDAGVLGVVQQLRANGLTVALATNQQSVRARYMREALPYQASFDECFYSCFIGAAKPRLQFFQATLLALGADPEEVLFVDDLVANVEGAVKLGLRGEVFPHSAGATELLRRLSRHGVAVDSPEDRVRG